MVMKTHYSIITRYPLAAMAALVLAPNLNAHIPGAHVENKTANSNFNFLPKVTDILNKVFAVETQKWWKWSFSLPVPQNPTVTPAGDCSNGQSGPVWYLYGGPPTVTCNMPFGKSVFFPVVNTECSDLETGTPFFGASAADRAACAN